MKKILKFLFSRYAVSALFILAELLILIYLILYGYSYSIVFVVLSSLVEILVIISLINRDTNPEFKLTWLAVVTLLPLVGGALYIIFYQRRMTRGESRLLEKISQGLIENRNETGESEYSIRTLEDFSNVSEVGAGRALSILKDDALSAIYSNSKTEYYETGESFFCALISELEVAEKYIFLEYFIVSEGKMWQRIYDILKEKAKNGVEVRMLYDDIGSMNTVPRGFEKELRANGIKCHSFARVNAKLTSSHNNRDHRKICVIDGRVAFTGGVNISDEYINEKIRFGHWKDGGIAVKGNAALGFSRLFLLLYDFTVREVSDYSEFLSFKEDTEDCRLDTGSVKSDDIINYINDSDKQTRLEKGYVIPFGSGPAPAYSAPVGKNVLMHLIDISKRYLYITTPYLIIDYELTQALRAASKRGVDVRIITPAKADKKLIKIMTKSSYPYLLQSGVRIFEYTPGFIHEKLFVSDDRCAVSGTINMDYRSLVHHFEDGIWMFLDPTIIGMRNSFLRTEEKSCEILPCDAKLGFFEKIIKSLIRILAPLL